MKNRFNRYCADVMGYEIRECPYDIGDYALWCGRKSKDNTDYDNFFSRLGFYYNPYDDINQMAEIVDAMLQTGGNIKGCIPFDVFIDCMNCAGNTKQAFRDFIISIIDNNEA